MNECRNRKTYCLKEGILMDWFKNFMAGRYGGDQLSIFLVIISLLLSLTGQFAESAFLFALSHIPLFVAIYRTFSRDIQKRSMENYKFAILFSPLYSKIKTTEKRIKDAKIYKYFNCVTCKTTLRVPRGKGKIMITCPKCKTKVMKKT